MINEVPAEQPIKKVKVIVEEEFKVGAEKVEEVLV